jgi:hypothetical protein
MKNFLSNFPLPEKLVKEIQNISIPDYRESNGHFQAPFPIMRDHYLDSVLKIAKDEKIAVLGISNYYVTDGFESFYKGCVENGIFPQFNMEFTGLMKEEQEKGIRINDTENPGRIYISGKGIDYPFETGWIQRRQMKIALRENQAQIKAMIAGINILIKENYPSMYISYDLVRNELSGGPVREHHIAKALRLMAERRFSCHAEQLGFYKKIMGRDPVSALSDLTGIEQELQSSFKKGGKAYIQEDENSYPDVRKIIKIIQKSGGIPCYHAQLGYPSGNISEFEGDIRRLHSSLKKLGIGCIELVPEHIDADKLKDFISFFDDRGFIITFGTDHYSYDNLESLKVTGKGNLPLEKSIRKIAWEGTCTIAAHQYLRADGRQGYVLPDGSHSVKQKKELTKLGQMIIEYYLYKQQ